MADSSISVIIVSGFHVRVSGDISNYNCLLFEEIYFFNSSDYYNACEYFSCINDLDRWGLGNCCCFDMI